MANAVMHFCPVYGNFIVILLNINFFDLLYYFLNSKFCDMPAGQSESTALISLFLFQVFS